MGNDTAITEMTVHDHAQYALGMLNCSHPDGSVEALNKVLSRLPEHSEDAIVIRGAIKRLEELAYEIADVEYRLANANFSFGKLEL